MSAVDLLSADAVRLAFVLGMILSVFLYEKSHLTTGSIVVPGFLGVRVFEPFTVAALIANSVCCFVLVHKILPKFLLMSARSKFHTLIVVSILIQLLWSRLAFAELPFALTASTMSELGFVIPGLVAHDMSRNGVQKTVINTLVVTYIVGGIIFFIVWWLPALSLGERRPSIKFANLDLPLMLAVGTLASLTLKLNTTIRSAGYVTSAYLVFFGSSPTVLIVITISAVLNYLVCCKMLVPQMIIFGRRKFALLLIVGSILTWGSIEALSSVGVGNPLYEHPAYAGIFILIPGLIANEIERTSISAVLSGAILTTSWIWIVCSLSFEFSNHTRPSQIFPLLLASIGIVCVYVLLTLIPSRHQSSLPIPSLPDFPPTKDGVIS